jgi:CDP-4-dehydro-6-deoxyglucose reductase, E3
VSFVQKIFIQNSNLVNVDIKHTMITPLRFKATLTKKEKISSKVYEVRFSLLEPSEITFHVGQTIMIYVAPGVNRSMSLASPPSVKNEITMCWDISPMGIGCQWLLSKNIGDVVEFMGPLGMFTYDSNSPRKAVFVATGTGVAPFHSALMEYLPVGSMKPATLYWGLRRTEDIFWNEQFEQWTKDYPSFQYNLCLSQPGDEWNGKRGHVEQHILAEENNLTNCDIYLCGSGEMIKEMVEALLSMNVPKEQIKRELFFG